jgi:hypothetical protein
MSFSLFVLYLCPAVGAVAMLVSMALLFMRRFYKDTEGKQATEIKWGERFTLKTSHPVIVLMLVGSALLGYSAKQAQAVVAAQKATLVEREVAAHGYLSGSAKSVILYAASASRGIPMQGDFTLTLPATHPSRPYQLLYTMNGQVVHAQEFDPAIGGKLSPVVIDSANEIELVGEIDPVPTGY